MITFEDVKNNEEVNSLIIGAQKQLDALGYTEHATRHISIVSNRAGYVLKELGYDEEYYNICLTHSYLNNDIVCTAGGVPNPKNNPFLTDFIKKHEYTIE